MIIQDILANIAFESGLPELNEEPRLQQMVIGWLERYKLYLQRDKRFFLSENTSLIRMTAEGRSTDLPSDYLFPIVIRRPRPGILAVTQDAVGQQFQVTKGLVLKRWISKEEFLDHFPIQTDEGAIHAGATNDYMIQNRNIVWGPIPREDETLYIDYFRVLPVYHFLDNPEDTISILYHDGLFFRGMYEVFDSYIPDASKSDRWLKRVMIAEAGLRKYQVGQEIPMESDLILRDT